VERPEEDGLTIIRATPLMNTPEDAVGEGVAVVGVVGAEGRFIDECRGGDGGRVEEW